jgi:uncharacterized protein DUF4136
MLKSIYAVFFAAIFFITACGPSLKVNSDFDKNVDFSKYKTFHIYGTDQISSSISDLNKERIIKAVGDEMQKKGFQQIGDTTADLMVNVVALLNDKVQLTSRSDYYGYGGMYRPYYWGGGAGYSTTTYDMQNYKDGSLIVDVVDGATRRLVWTGAGNKEIDKPIKDPETKIPKAVNMIMASFPPGAKKQ